MKRYFIELSYNGAKYSGWQIQPNAFSVQQTIEISLHMILSSYVNVVGCGRTDTGVHASFYTAHFDYDGEYLIDTHFTYHLNCILPKDISIHRVYLSSLHARFDATMREYKYYITAIKEPFKGEFSWLITTPLNLEAMQLCFEELLVINDFTSFTKLHSDTNNNICDVRMVDISQDKDNITLTIQANRYLRGMVRAIVGTLVDVGKGKLSIIDFRNIIQALNRKEASAQAPAKGLFLTDVRY